MRWQGRRESDNVEDRRGQSGSPFGGGGGFRRCGGFGRRGDFCGRGRGRGTSHDGQDHTQNQKDCYDFFHEFSSLMFLNSV